MSCAALPAIRLIALVPQGGVSHGIENSGLCRPLPWLASLR